MKSFDKISVVIPTLNAMQYLPGLFQALRSQKPYPPCEILIVDSSSTDGTADYVAGAGPDVRLISIDRSAFSHGRSRNLGVRHSCGDYVVFLSQDALPLDNVWLAELLSPFKDQKVAAVFSRQVPRPDANPMERFFLQTHFPAGETRFMRRNGNGDFVFQRDVFFSNVSSAVRKSVIVRHPFDETLIMSEDQQFARDVILAGHTVVYAPSSVVMHSHNYSYRQAVGRYFDSVLALRQIFPKHSFSTSVRIGSRYLRQEAVEIILKHPLILPRYVGYVFAKTTGTLLGHAAEKLPAKFARRISLHKNWWGTETTDP